MRRSPSQESQDILSGRQSSVTDGSTPAPVALPGSSRSSSCDSAGSPPTHNGESEDPESGPDQDASDDRRFSQTLLAELSTRLSEPRPLVLIAPMRATEDTSLTQSPRSASPPVTLPRALREIAALSSLPSYALPLLEMGFSRRHVIQAMMATGTGDSVDARRINMLVTWLLEHPVSDDGVGATPKYTPFQTALSNCSLGSNW